MADIKINNISMVFKKEDSSFTALDNINLDLKSGEFVSVIGPSGCGKTTLIDIIAGIRKPSSGEVLIDNNVVKKPSPEIGVVFQDYFLFPWMTAYENLYFAFKNTNDLNKSLNDDEIKDKAKKHLEIVGLSDFADTFPKALSGGMRQRLAISRMFGIDSKVFLMDEPFGALDALNRMHMQDLLIYLWSNGNKKQTTLYVTHDVDESIFLSDKIIVMTPSHKIKEIIEVPFPRPRDRTRLNEDEKYLKLRNRILSLLNEEMVIALNNQEEQARRYYG